MTTCRLQFTCSERLLWSFFHFLLFFVHLFMKYWKWHIFKIPFCCCTPSLFILCLFFFFSDFTTTIFEIIKQIEDVYAKTYRTTEAVSMKHTMWRSVLMTDSILDSISRYLRERKREIKHRTRVFLYLIHFCILNCLILSHFVLNSVQWIRYHGV